MKGQPLLISGCPLALSGLCPFGPDAGPGDDLAGQVDLTFHDLSAATVGVTGFSKEQQADGKTEPWPRAESRTFRLQAGLVDDAGLPRDGNAHWRRQAPRDCLGQRASLCADGLVPFSRVGCAARILRFAPQEVRARREGSPGDRSRLFLRPQPDLGDTGHLHPPPHRLAGCRVSGPKSKTLRSQLENLARIAG